MFGVSNKYAMVPGGATTGFGNLAAALLLSPQLHRRDVMEAQRYKDQNEFQNKQLAQALQMSQDRNQTERDIADARGKALDTWHSDDNQRKWAEDLGRGGLNLINALGLNQDSDSPSPSARASSSGAKASKASAFNPYKTVEEETPDGKVLKSQVPKSQDDIDQELTEQDYVNKGGKLGGALWGKVAPAPVPVNTAPAGVGPASGVVPQGPTDDPAADNQIDLQRTQAQQARKSQMAAGQAVQQPIPPPPGVTPQGKLVPTSALKSKVGPGGYPDVQTAAAAAQAAGYHVLDDDQVLSANAPDTGP